MYLLNVVYSALSEKDAYISCTYHICTILTDPAAAADRENRWLPGRVLVLFLKCCTYIVCTAYVQDLKEQMEGLFINQIIHLRVRGYASDSF